MKRGREAILPAWPDAQTKAVLQRDSFLAGTCVSLNVGTPSRVVVLEKFKSRIRCSSPHGVQTWIRGGSSESSPGGSLMGKCDVMRVTEWLIEWGASQERRSVACHTSEFAQREREITTIVGSCANYPRAIWLPAREIMRPNDAESWPIHAQNRITRQFIGFIGKLRHFCRSLIIH